MKLLELYIFCGHPRQVKFQGLSMWFLPPASNSSLVWSGEMVRGIPTTPGHEFSKSDCVCVAWLPPELSETGPVWMVLRRPLPRKPIRAINTALLGCTNGWHQNESLK